jgi:hypothetical protein
LQADVVHWHDLLEYEFAEPVELLYEPDSQVDPLVAEQVYAPYFVPPVVDWLHEFPTILFVVLEHWFVHCKVQSPVPVPPVPFVVFP